MPGSLLAKTEHEPISQSKGVRLVLSGGCSIRIVAADGPSEAMIARLRVAMQLQPDATTDESAVVLVSDTSADVTARVYDRMTSAPRDQDPAAFATALRLIRISLEISSHAQARGTVLLHGALAEMEGDGVVLAGPGGIGKTTASRRLTAPWHSLSDDATLVVRDADGRYWAHPWPTWSQFVTDGPGGSWDVQHAVRLRGLFFLKQAEKDQVDPVGTGHAVTLLIESSEQAWWGMSPHLSREEQRASRLQRLDNICALAKTVPTHILSFTSTGAFWTEIERALTGKAPS